MTQSSLIKSSCIPSSILLNKEWVMSMIALLMVSVGVVAWTGEFLFLLAPWIVVLLKIFIEYPKSLYWIFVISLAVSAEITFSNGLSLSVPDEPLMIGILGLMILLVVWNYKILPSWLWQSPIILILVLQYAWTLVTVFFAKDILLAGKFFLAKTWFMTSFIFFAALFIKDKRDIKWTFILFSVPVILHSFVAFLLHASEGFGYWESNTVVRPFYRNHVDYGSILSMVFPAVFVCILMRKKWDVYKWILLGVFCYLCLAIFVAYSRAAILAAIFSIIIFIGIRLRLAQWILPGLLAFIFSAILLLSYNNNYLKFRPNMSKNATQETFVETVMGAFTGKDMSSMERFYRWIASVRMSQDEPIVGVGPNNWYFHYKPHSVTAFKTWVSRNEERSTTHNYFLLMLTEQGYSAMILYAILMMTLISTGQRTYYRFKDKTYKYYTLIVVMIIASCFVNNFFSEFLETHKVGGMFYLSVLILAYLRHLSLKEKTPVTDEKLLS